MLRFDVNSISSQAKTFFQTGCDKMSKAPKRVYDFALRIFNQMSIFFRSLFFKRVETSPSNISTEVPPPPQSPRPALTNEEPLPAKNNIEVRTPEPTTKKKVVYDSFFSQYLSNQ